MNRKDVVLLSKCQVVIEHSTGIMKRNNFCKQPEIIWLTFMISTPSHRQNLKKEICRLKY